MMRRTLLLRAGAVLFVVAAGVLGAAVSLRSYGPSAEWNVFADAPTQTPTPTATATATPTATPTSTFTPTPTPTITPTPLPTWTPTATVPPANPPGIPGAEAPGERWVDVDVSRQTAT